MDGLHEIPNSSSKASTSHHKMAPIGSGSKSSPHSEKLDITPENSEKRDFNSSASPVGENANDYDGRKQSFERSENAGVENNNVQYIDNKNMSKSCSMQEMGSVKSQQEQEAEVKKTLAFTIDFGMGQNVNTQRHRSILERFEQQQRHKRGQSLSKLEDTNGRRNSPAPPMTPHKPPMSGKLPRRKIMCSDNSSFSSEQEDPKTAVTVQVRLRDRSTSQLRDSSKRHSWSPRSSLHEPQLNKPVPTKFVPKSSALASAMDGKSYPSLESNTSNDPHSLDSFLCPEPPLENFQADPDNVSDAGTYTVEGDNYTEEQKDKMNIDKLGVIYEPEASPKPVRPTHFEGDLEIIELDREEEPRKPKKNVLEVSCCHENATSVKPKVSYLDKLKSRVRNISEKASKKSASPEKALPLPSPDVGTFTSVTVSGVLSVKPVLADSVGFRRRNSLTKATIDSSEYVQGISKIHVNNVVESPKTATTSSDDDKSLSSTTALKTASTKKDWIQEWARNAREFSSKKQSSTPPMARSYDFETKPDRHNVRQPFPDFEYSSDPTLRYKEYQNIRRQQLHLLSPSKMANKNAMLYGAEESEQPSSGYFGKPPPSPTKIPSPIHTIARPRSSSRNHSVHGSMTNLDDDTELHLQNTAAAISALQNLHRRNSVRNSHHNSPKTSLSPVHRVSPDDFSSPRHRNFSVDHQLMTASATSEGLRLRRPSTDFDQTTDYRRLGYEYEDEEDDDVECAGNIVIVEKGRIVSGSVPSKKPVQAVSKVAPRIRDKLSAPTSSPIKRSSSFSVKAQQPPTPLTPKLAASRASNNSIQKSASSTSFRKLLHYDEDDVEFYVNVDDALDHDLDYNSDSNSSEEDGKEPITNTRYNKAFLMRIEQSKKAISGAPTRACPNTPEMSRREMNVRRDRASMPRDASLNRLKQDISSLNSAKKQLGNGNKEKRVQPKYLDISKYKSPAGGNSFLKRDESRSYLLPAAKPEVKRSPSSASVLMTRSDPSRASTRSVKSAGARPNPMTKKNDAIAAAQKAKEQELEMWKRRAKYDPMKAAAEGKRKQEEARRQVQQDRLSKSSESAVLRSQSFHSGVGNSINLRGGADHHDNRNRWTLTSTESSDIEDDLTTTS